MRTFPSFDWSSPLLSLIIVIFPDPFGPSKLIISQFRFQILFRQFLSRFRNQAITFVIKRPDVR